MLFAVLLTFASCKTDEYKLDLSGKWSVFLDREDTRQPGNGEFHPIDLPGTTDQAGLGEACTLEPSLGKPQILHLTRKYKYVGAAYYEKEFTVPSSWEGSRVLLHLERVMWESSIMVDGIPAGEPQTSLSTPQVYDLTDVIIPGKTQKLSIRIDNREIFKISRKGLAHAYTEQTQVKWNGILGDIFLEAVPQTCLENVRIFPNTAEKEVRVVARVQNSNETETEASLAITVRGQKDKKESASLSSDVRIAPGSSEIEFRCSLEGEVREWSEQDPFLYEVSAILEANGQKSVRTEIFGFRELSHEGNIMKINGRPLFLRGTLECCIFPLTGTPPTERAGWEKVFRAASDYGLNHLRFHSWCPPEAAFEVADEMGFYLQVELPVWSFSIGEDKPTLNYLEAEALRISEEYGNHPSFCLWSMGNELKGDFEWLTALMKKLKEKDPRHLYTTTTFSFQEGHGLKPEPEDDFFVTQWTSDGWVRGQGVFNQEVPSFDKDYSAAMKEVSVPLVSHEIGQYSVYPNVDEVVKYTGSLLPLNILGVRKDLEEKGLLDKAGDYLQASGHLSAILYKEEIERALKTPGISGFQLLDLHDFPGQGTALVGLLDAFWDSKGIISPKEFRQFCSPVVPLLKFPKAVYTTSENFSASIEAANYSDQNLDGELLHWQICDGKNILASGNNILSGTKIGHNANLGQLNIDLSGVNKACRLDIFIRIGKEHCNSWKIWVYPEDTRVDFGDVRFTADYNEALELLGKGSKVLFNPDWKTMKGIEGKFVPVFWSPVHFPNQAGTMGILCNPAHPVFNSFPTESHSDWQWWDLNINSTTLVTDSLKGGEPLVEVVDNFLKNRRLASLLEGKVGPGTLVLATFDLHTDIDNRPVAKAMLRSILDYMNSPSFNPAELSGFAEMQDVFGTAENTKQDASGIYSSAFINTKGVGRKN